MDKATNSLAFRSIFTPWYLYYNKTSASESGCWTRMAKPMGLESIEAFKKMLTAVKDKARVTPIVAESAPAGPAGTWRAWYTLLQTADRGFH